MRLYPHCPPADASGQAFRSTYLHLSAGIPTAPFGATQAAPVEGCHMRKVDGRPRGHRVTKVRRMYVEPLGLRRSQHPERHLNHIEGQPFEASPHPRIETSEKYL